MSAYSALVLTKSPALYWRLGASGGTDSSGNSRTGTAAGSVTIGGATSLLVSDSADAATTFDGVDDKITSTYNPHTAGTVISYSLWVKRTSNATDDSMVAGAGTNGPHFNFQTSGDVIGYSPDRVHVADVTWTSTGAGTATTHVGLTFDDPNNVAELFINGVSKGTKAMASTYDATPGNLQIGAELTSTNPFLGVIDEFAVFTTVLTASDFLAQYNAGISAASGSLVYNPQPLAHLRGR